MTEDMVGSDGAVRPRPRPPRRRRCSAYADAGVDELYVQQIGPEQDAFFDEWAPAVLPRSPDRCLHRNFRLLERVRKLDLLLASSPQTSVVTAGCEMRRSRVPRRPSAALVTS